MRYSSFLLSLAAFLPAVLAQENCDIIANHTVVSGDTLGAIATAANVTLDQILFVNPSIENANFINLGDIIAIPDSACIAPTSADPIEPTATCTNGTATEYTVVAGDTFTIIANEKLGITLTALIAANPQVTDVNLIDVGDVLNIPVCTTTTTESVSEVVVSAEKKLYHDCLTTKVGARLSKKSFKSKKVGGAQRRAAAKL